MSHIKFIPKNLIANQDFSHKMKTTSEYITWQNMKRRIIDPSRNVRYGAKGVTICTRWAKSFKDFYEDMGPKPTPSHSIDRIDNTKGYEPGNCRWATIEQQNRNKSGHSSNVTGVKGVSFRRDTGKYTARISIGKRGSSKNINLGCFDTILEAAKVRKQAELRYF